jgi:formimidoylglutamate deiminase
MDSVTLTGRCEDEILDAFVFCGTSGLVGRLWSAGRLLVADGRHVARAQVSQDFRATMARLRDRL